MRARVPQPQRAVGRAGHQHLAAGDVAPRHAAHGARVRAEIDDGRRLERAAGCLERAARAASVPQADSAVESAAREQARAGGALDAAAAAKGEARDAVGVRGCHSQRLRDQRPAGHLPQVEQPSGVAAGEQRALGVGGERLHARLVRHKHRALGAVHGVPSQDHAVAGCRVDALPHPRAVLATRSQHGRRAVPVEDCLQLAHAFARAVPHLGLAVGAARHKERIHALPPAAEGERVDRARMRTRVRGLREHAVRSGDARRWAPCTDIFRNDVLRAAELGGVGRPIVRQQRASNRLAAELRGAPPHAHAAIRARAGHNGGGG